MRVIRKNIAIWMVPFLLIPSVVFSGYEKIFSNLREIDTTLVDIIKLEKIYWSNNQIDLQDTADLLVLNTKTGEKKIIESCSLSNSTGEISCTVGSSTNVHKHLRASVITLTPYYIKDNGVISNYSSRTGNPNLGFASEGLTPIVEYQCEILSDVNFEYFKRSGQTHSAFEKSNPGGILASSCSNAIVISEDNVE